MEHGHPASRTSLRASARPRAWRARYRRTAAPPPAGAASPPAGLPRKVSEFDQAAQVGRALEEEGAHERRARGARKRELTVPLRVARRALAPRALPPIRSRIERATRAWRSAPKKRLERAQRHAEVLAVDETTDSLPPTRASAPAGRARAPPDRQAPPAGARQDAAGVLLWILQSYGLPSFALRARRNGSLCAVDAAPGGLCETGHRHAARNSRGNLKKNGTFTSA